tara:strand:- start:29 stop:343 length:315 start_codon:yes stop_codon:yes gene_type:complete
MSEEIKDLYTRFPDFNLFNGRSVWKHLRNTRDDSKNDVLTVSIGIGCTIGFYVLVVDHIESKFTTIVDKMFDNLSEAEAFFIILLKQYRKAKTFVQQNLFGCQE